MRRVESRRLRFLRHARKQFHQKGAGAFRVCIFARVVQSAHVAVSECRRAARHQRGLCAVCENGDGRAEAINHLLSKYEHYPACEALKKEQDSQAARFIEYASRPDGQKFYRQSLGLCLPHLRAVLALQPSEEIAKFLLNEQAEHFNDLADDMRSYTLKRDAISRGSMNSNEVNAWRRTLVQLVGERTAHIP